VVSRERQSPPSARRTAFANGVRNARTILPHQDNDNSEDAHLWRQHVVQRRADDMPSTVTARHASIQTWSRAMKGEYQIWRRLLASGAIRAPRTDMTAPAGACASTARPTVADAIIYANAGAQEEYQRRHLVAPEARGR